jgi:Tol biopolymer transport system component
MTKLYTIHPNIAFIIIFFSIRTILAQQEVLLKIQSNEYQPIILAVSSFPSTPIQNYSHQIRQIIINDLRFSGYFIIIDEEENIQQMHTPVDFGKVAVYLHGQIKSSGKELMLALRLAEKTNQNIILEKNYTLNLENLRADVHHVSFVI